jgi:inward rectifier potassium channel
MITVSWLQFFLVLAGGFLFANILFAFGYLLCGPEALQGVTGGTPTERFVETFFFSVQTLSTIGYGRVNPVGLASNILVTVEAPVGLLGFALATGLLFARFSRPIADIIFSHNAVVAPYQEKTAFEFRLTNARTYQMIEASISVTFTRMETVQGKATRKFYDLALERNRVQFLPLHWVIVHPIDENSPLFGLSKDDLERSDAEIMVLFAAVDETFSQTVHARTSYKANETIWDAKFADIFVPSQSGKVGIDLRKIHNTEKVAQRKDQ